MINVANGRPSGLPEPGLAEPPVLVTEACQGCGACLLTCPEHAIRPHGKPLEVLADLCTGCLECIEICPVDAIAIRAVRESDT